MEFSINRGYQNTIICVDSLASVQSIVEKFTFDPLVQKIQNLLKESNEQSKRFIFVWIPRHAGITGNKIAEKAANTKTKVSKIDCDVIRTEDQIRQNKKIVNKIWQNELETKQNKLKEIKPSTEKWKNEQGNINRRDNVILMRLRIGHTRLTSEYLMKKDSPPMCSMCNTQLTIRHIIEECQKYDNIMNHLQIPRDITKALSNDYEMCRKILKFCKASQIEDKI